MLVDIFSVSTDKVRDISNHEQLTVTIRFVDNENQIREEFIAFIDVSEGTTGEISSKEMLWFIFKVGLDPQKTSCHDYYGSGNMPGKIKGVGSRIQWQYPRAIPFWCVAHQLNQYS